MDDRTIIIVGAGVTGLSTAYHLALRKAGKIIVIDQGSMGNGSSSRAAGIITNLLWTETGVVARKIAIQRFRELSGELQAYRFNNCGCLNWFDNHSWKERETILKLYDRHDVPYEILSAVEIRKRWPDLRPKDNILGLFDPNGGYSEPNEYLPAITTACLKSGVSLREHLALKSILTKSGRVTGVLTEKGPIAADVVISTSYAWTNLVLDTVDIQLPVKSFVHQRYVTRQLSKPLQIPAVNANPLYGYFRPASDGRLLVGYETANRQEYKVVQSGFSMTSLSAPPEVPQLLMETFSEVLPALETTSIESEHVGIITFSMDNEPIVGPIRQVEGLFVAVAFHSGGFAYNPVTGMLLADYVIDGKPRIDLSAFLPDRFDSSESKKYLAATLRQNSPVQRRH